MLRKAYLPNATLRILSRISVIVEYNLSHHMEPVIAIQIDL
jgi:hypothetical protein